MTIPNSVTTARCVIAGALLASVVALAATRSPTSQPGGATTTHADAGHPKNASPTEQDFLEANASAMTTMMRGMQSQPTGDIDRDFVQQMIPHHQGAIDMAKALLKAGHNERLKRLAQEIIITQQEEIATMRLLAAEQESAENAQRRSVPRRTGARHPTRMYASTTANRDPS